RLHHPHHRVGHEVSAARTAGDDQRLVRDGCTSGRRRHRRADLGVVPVGRAALLGVRPGPDHRRPSRPAGPDPAGPQPRSGAGAVRSARRRAAAGPGRHDPAGGRNAMRRTVRLPTVPMHSTRTAELAGQVATLPSGGLVLGTTDEAPLIVRMFRAQPLRVCIAGPVELAQLITYRAVALGAHVTVVTDAVAQWTRLVSAVPRGPHWM